MPKKHAPHQTLYRMQPKKKKKQCVLGRSCDKDPHLLAVLEHKRQSAIRVQHIVQLHHVRMDLQRPRFETSDDLIELIARTACIYGARCHDISAEEDRK